MNYKEAILTENLSKTYGSLKAVNNLNLKVKPGKIYGLLGPNGAGKTTIVRMLNGIIKPTSGSARLLGYDLKTQIKKIKKRTGYLPESPALYQKLTAIEYLEYVGELYYLPKDLIRKRIKELLNLFDLSSRGQDLLEEFSRGMKQKVCLCAGLIHDPDIVFLDEPTSNLDPASAKIVKDLILIMRKKINKTIFICTHLLDIAEELCDVIGIIYEGNLKLEGTREEIISQKNADSLEDAYIKILNITQDKDLLSWR